METNELIGALLYKKPNLKIPLIALGVISKENNILSVKRPEFDNILSVFNNPLIISVFSITQLTVLIEPVLINRKLSVLIINGSSSYIKQMSFSLINDLLFKNLNIKDFLPSTFVRKIVYICDYKLLENSSENLINNLVDNKKEIIKGLVFSEYIKNYWTIDDPLSLPGKNVKKISPNSILLEILEDIKQKCI